jgi:holo-[acyl-carrier protein] synthase
LSLRGIGTDLVAIGRVEELLGRHGSRFLARCFRPGEVAGGSGVPVRRDLAAHVAGRWAVKEACLKALGGDLRGIPYRDIEVQASAGGGPEVVLHGRAAAALAACGGRRILASISHERDLAVGFVVIED